MKALRVAAVTAVALAGLWAAPCLAAGPAPPPSTEREVRRDTQHEAGRAVYNFRCYFCHGYAGDAHTLAATYLDPRPRDFTRSALSPADIAAAIRDGRGGTAMKSFRGVLSEVEIDAVAAFVASEFVQRKAANTTYHTEANGWPQHERHAAAFPFARGDIALDTPVSSLSPAQQGGRRLFLATCISCHDRARVDDEGPAWSARPLSYPRMGFMPGQPVRPPVDAVSSASVYAKHEVPPPTTGLNPRERRGAALFQSNCAFCHGADGSGKNWIGQFMEPKARDLTQYTLDTMPPERLRQRIREGLPGTSMPAWQHVLNARQIDELTAFITRTLYRAAAGASAGR